MKVVLLPQAEADLNKIFDPVRSRIVRRLRLLERFPELGAKMVGPFNGYRSSVVEMFRIVYRIASARTLEIAYIPITVVPHSPGELNGSLDGSPTGRLHRRPDAITDRLSRVLLWRA